MIITRAKKEHIGDINKLLLQVLGVHHKGRPDLFKKSVKKYNDDELLKIIEDDKRPIFVALENGRVLGYAFCVYVKHENDNILTDIKTLYIDDLCVDENERGKHIGKSIYEHVVNFAKKEGFYNITLNVWALNEGAKKFYEKCGFVPQKIGMEMLLKNN